MAYIGVSTASRAGRRTYLIHGEKGAKSEYLLEVHVLGHGDDSTRVRDRRSGTGWTHGCPVRKGGLFVFCVSRGSPAVGRWRCCLHWDGCETASLRTCWALMLLYNYRCTDTATVIILFIPIMSARSEAASPHNKHGHVTKYACLPTSLPIKLMPGPNTHAPRQTRAVTPGYDEQNHTAPTPSTQPTQNNNRPHPPTRPSLNKSQRQNILYSRHGLLVSGGVLLLRLLGVLALIRLV